MPKEKTIQINNDLLNAITPFGGMAFYRSKMLLGENIAKIYGVTRYPPALLRGWAARVSNLPNVISCQMFEPCDNGVLIADLSKSVSRYRGIESATRDTLERQRAEKSANDAERLMRQIDENGEVVGYMSNLALIIGRDEQALDKSCRKFEATMAGLNCKARLLVNQTKEAFKTVSPYNVPHEEILNLTRRNVPMSSFIEGFPFASNAFVDIKGYPFGRNSKNGLVVLDPWVRGGDRTNSNFAVLGVAGVGKSTIVKYMMISEFMTGSVVVCVDPEREYAELTKNLEGDLINAGGGAFIINPLQFKSVPLDDDDEDNLARLYDNEDGQGISAMALHFKSLEVFFKLYYPEITSKQMALLKQLLEMLYAAFDIGWHTDPAALNNTDYPTLSDLYALAQKVQEDSGLKRAYKDDLSELAIILRELAKGADSFIWNGHTTIEPKSSFICLDTYDLHNTSDNVKRAQYYNLLTWAWERMSRDRGERVMLYADEAYLLVDPNVPQSLMYLRNIEKRARKYMAGLCVISHSVVDFLDPAVKMYGQALLDIPCYKIIMGTDGVNLLELSKIYNLSDNEQEKLAHKKRGVAIFFVGSRRFVVNFDGEISAYEMNLMGKGGGK